MYDREAIQECLCSLVGWYQTNNPDYPQLDSGLLVSDSDLYFQDGHALIDIENIDQAFKNYDHYNFPNWDVGTTYNTDDRVRNPSDNLIYKSLIDNNLGNQPDLSPNEWEEVNLLSIALKQQMQSSVNEILNNAFLMKKFDKNVKALFQNTRLFDWTRSVKDKVVKKGRFVGLEIVPRRDINLAVVLQKIGTDFDTLNPNLTIYVYHSSQEAPIDTLTINHNKVNSHVWTILTDKVLTYMADTHDAGGSFYIGYYEDDLLGQAIEKTNIDFRLGPCRTCSSRTWTMWNTWSQYLSVTPFSVSSQNLNGTNLWDVDDNNQD